MACLSLKFGFVYKQTNIRELFIEPHLKLGLFTALHTTATYIVCQNDTELVKHVLWHCPNAKKIRASSGLSSLMRYAVDVVSIDFLLQVWKRSLEVLKWEKLAREGSTPFLFRCMLDLISMKYTEL